MAKQNVNVVVLTGNLTQDPELTHANSGTAICNLRLAVNVSRKQGDEWVDKPNFFNVVSFGARAEAQAKHLKKGRPVAVEGQLDWREWEAKDGSGKRQAVQILADTVEFLGSRPQSSQGSEEAAQAAAEEMTGAGAGGGEEDIPF